MSRLLIPFLFLCLASCQIDGDKGVDRTKFTFKTGDDTELFFKNIRQSYYSLEENKQANFNLFRFESTPVLEEAPQIKTAIVMNILQDEAYVLIETNSFFGDYQPINLQWRDSSSNEGSIELEAYNRDAMLEFSTQVYESILKSHDITTELNGRQYELFTDKKEREAFRITMSDYYRLTRVF